MKMNKNETPKELTFEKRIEFLFMELEHEIKSYKEDMVKFIEDFKLNPVYAFEWSNSKFKSAARLRYIEFQMKNIKEILDGKSKSYKTLTSLFQDIAEEIVKQAKWNPSSSSQTSNIMEQYNKSAVAYFYDRFHNVTKYELVK